MALGFTAHLQDGTEEGSVKKGHDLELDKFYDAERWHNLNIHLPWLKDRRNFVRFSFGFGGSIRYGHREP